ncbi:MAG TPA: hypothetical protein VN939_16520 [Chthoniobacterales bacterium]|nr:hypothetical protein [Chthoniobacterales bacterium]
MSQVHNQRATPACRDCLHFENDPSVIEKEYPGLTAMSSGFASVRADDGLCRLHDLYLSGWDTCSSHARSPA